MDVDQRDHGRDQRNADCLRNVQLHSQSNGQRNSGCEYNLRGAELGGGARGTNAELHISCDGAGERCVYGSKLYGRRWNDALYLFAGGGAGVDVDQRDDGRDQRNTDYVRNIQLHGQSDGQRDTCREHNLCGADLCGGTRDVNAELHISGDGAGERCVYRSQLYCGGRSARVYLFVGGGAGVDVNQRDHGRDQRNADYVRNIQLHSQSNGQ